jgi:hypothetical protein
MGKNKNEIQYLYPSATDMFRRVCNQTLNGFAGRRGRCGNAGGGGGGHKPRCGQH